MRSKLRNRSLVGGVALAALVAAGATYASQPTLAEGGESGVPQERR